MVEIADLVSDSEEPKWYFFNNFSVLPVENEERVFQNWKVLLANADSMYFGVC
jgi:hypothetical protein